MMHRIPVGDIIRCCEGYQVRYGKEGRLVSNSDLMQWSGLAAMVAGVLLSVGALLSLTESEDLSVSATTASYTLTSTLYLLGGVLLLLGLLGLYIRQSRASGTLGLVAFLVAFFGTTLAVGATWAELFVAPTLAVEAPTVLDAEPTGMLALGFTLTFLVFLPLGWLLFGVASFRARIYPRAAAILLMVGAVIAGLPIPLSEIVLYVGVVWLGFVLFTERGETVQQPMRVR
jgi:hypothetical protein